MDYRLTRGEDLQTGFQRILLEQLRYAENQLARNRSRDKAVHETRKAIKKIRSVLRLIREALGEDRYQAANSALREIGLSLSPMRDAHVMHETLRAFGQASAGRRRDTTVDFAPLIAGLAKLREDAKSWQFTGITKELVIDGYTRTLARFGKSFRAAYEHREDEAFHDWRKRAKDLRYQSTLLRLLWPALFDVYAAAAKETEALLGEDHNLAVLRPTVDGPRKRTLIARISRRQRVLRDEAHVLGLRLTAEDPKGWKQRLAAWWSIQ